MNDVESWVVWEHDDDAAKLLKKSSALETLATRVTMSSDVRMTGQNEAMVVRKFGSLDMYETIELELGELRLSMYRFAKQAGVILDNQFLGFSGECEVGDRYPAYTTSSEVRTIFRGDLMKSESLYDKTPSSVKVHTNEDVHPYLEGMTNVVKSSSPSWARPGIIAHPLFRKKMGRSNQYNGLPVFFTMGAIKTDKPTSDPKGNALFFVGDMSELQLGVRSGPETTIRCHNDEWYDSAFDEGPAFLYEEYSKLDGENKKNVYDLVMSLYGTTMIKSRIRRAFYVPEENSFHCIEMSM